VSNRQLASKAAARVAEIREKAVFFNSILIKAVNFR
jgi:hypothetical protein